MEQTRTRLLDRQLKEVTTVNSSRLNLSVLQWNTLARCHSNVFPLLPNQVSDFDHRKVLISQEIKSYSADIICLEEVDKKDVEFFKTLYPDAEYSFSFVKKPHSPDGTCIMIKKPIQVVETEPVQHRNEETNKVENLISQIVVAKCPSKDGDISLIVATCHLKADTPAKSCDDVRMRQAKQLMEAIQKKKQKCLETNKEEDVIVVLCGDFNAGPETPAMQNFFSDEDIGLKTVFNDEPYTLFQMYGNNDFTVKCVVDNVLYSKSLVLTKKIEAPMESQVGKDGLLSENFPSDHLSLCCVLALPEQRTESV